MPVISSAHDPRLAIIEFLGYLMSPKDNLARAAIEQSTIGVVMAQAFARDLIDPSTMNRELKQVVAEAPAPGTFFQSFADEADVFAWDVGEILLTVLSLSEHASSAASVNKAIALQLRRMAMRNREMVTPDHLMRKWSALKPVSHFLGALAMGCGVNIIRVPHLLSVWSLDGPQKDLKFNRDAWRDLPLGDAKAEQSLFAALMEWISVADELRRKAHQVYAHGQKAQGKPLLSEEETWFFGPEVGLARCPFQMLRLPQDEMDYLLN